jgi:phage tail sheath protein FI
MSQRGQGIVLFGDKTMQSKPSAFDAINVRRLFIVLEKSIATAAKYQLFEQNDAITRQIFVNMVTPFLRGVKGRRGIDDFLVDVGPLVNTSEVINLKQFKANIYVRPVGAIRNIILNFIATPYGVEFSEYVMGG